MADTNERTPLLKVEHLSKEFPAESGMFAKRFSKRVVSAVNDISFEIYPGETFGLVGESGCGKSTTGRTIMRLTKPTAGKVFFQGKDVAEMSKHEIKDMRREMQFIFQDPYASLNPRMTIGEIVSEPMTIHGVGTKEERIERVRELLDVVGLNPEHINRYPHEFSGGQRQRVGIAAQTLHIGQREARGDYLGIVVAVLSYIYIGMTVACRQFGPASGQLALLPRQSLVGIGAPYTLRLTPHAHVGLHAVHPRGEASVVIGLPVPHAVLYVPIQQTHALCTPRSLSLACQHAAGTRDASQYQHGQHPHDTAAHTLSLIHI